MPEVDACSEEEIKSEARVASLVPAADATDRHFANCIPLELAVVYDCHIRYPLLRILLSKDQNETARSTCPTENLQLSIGRTIVMFERRSSGTQYPAGALLTDTSLEGNAKNSYRKKSKCP